MNKEQLQNLLHEEYTTENWKEVAKFVFPNVQFFQKPSIKEVNDDKVKFLKVLGSAKLNDGKNLAILEVTVSENTNIARNRVELWSKVNKLIDQERNHGLLVIFEQGKDDYRFTFTAKSTEFDNEKLDFVNRETDSKRFTYVLGKNESCKTPAERFYSLAQNKDKADIKAVEDAFSVEKLSKQFFKEYKEHYLKFVNFLISNNSYRTAIFKENEKEVRDFVKLMLGRLVFIQFVQKKRWMGVPADSTGWDSGDPKFLYNSFKAFKNKELFYSQFLEPLFYGALSKNERKNDIFTVTGTKIPFLNGGLFEKSNIDTSSLCFPAEYFDELFEFFDRYNFTINEYDSIEHEIGIDPEMLGSIFENLLEDNKDKGAFYTPKEIVHYMCQESLKEYLKTYLQEKKLWKDNDELEPALEAFVKQKEASGLIDYDEQLAIALRDVKICDPAIGSGAFPMGLLNEIFQCVNVLHSVSKDSVEYIWGMDNWQPDVVKKNIIQNSIYGVDIEKGAVDIARLRFWLSLIIDEPEPHALPNLDYKIVVGNSLLSKYGDEIIDIDWSLNYMSQGLFAAEIAKEKESLLKSLSKKQIEFFNHNSDKTKLTLEIRNLKIDLIINQLQLMIDKQNIQKKPIEQEYGNKTKFVKATELFLQTENWRRIIKQLQNLKTQNDKPLEFFDWKLDFPEIMNENVAKKVGFDIVIGNPPYVFSRENISNEIKVVFNKYYHLTQFKINLYILFIEKGYSLLKSTGTFIFITPNNWLTLETNSDLRQFILYSTYNIKILQNYANVFESASVDTVIVGFNKIGDNTVKYLEWKNNNPCLISNKLKDEYLSKPKFIISDNQIDDKNIFMLKIKGKELRLICDVKNGVQAYTVGEGTPPCTQEMKKQRVYHNDRAIDDSWFKYLDGVDVGRYNLGWSGQFIKYGRNLSRPRKFDLFKRERILVRQIPNKLPYCINATFIDETTINDNNSMIVKLLDDNYKLKYILALLNSKLISIWFAIYFGKLSRKIFPQFKINELRIFPIAFASIKTQEKFEILVNKLYLQKYNNIEYTRTECEIDNLVYRLYDLTYDEVKVIDPEFSLSKEEYENIKID